jgi:hypothetical protein
MNALVAFWCGRPGLGRDSEDDVGAVRLVRRGFSGKWVASEVEFYEYKTVLQDLGNVRLIDSRGFRCWVHEHIEWISVIVEFDLVKLGSVGSVDWPAQCRGQLSVAS